MYTDLYRFTAMNSFGQVVRSARLAAGLTQVEVAHRVGITQPHLSAVERGSDYAGRATVLALREVLSLDEAWSVKAFLEGYAAKLAVEQGIDHVTAHAALLADVERACGDARHQS